MRCGSLVVGAWMGLAASLGFAQNSLDFDAFKTFLEKNHPANGDALLDAFAHDAKFRALLSSVALVHSSHDPQARQVTAHFPRILLHQDRLVLAMTGNPSLAGYDQIEALELGRDDRFHFYEVRLDKTPAITEPRTCAACHGTGDSARPIWDAYDLWPGAYGAVEDRIAYSSTERARLLAFLHSINTEDASHRRYRKLRFTDAWQISEPQVARDGLLEWIPSTLRSWARHELTLNVPEPRRALRHSPNQALFTQLSALNFHRLRRRLERKDLLEKNRYALLAAFLPCGPVSQFVPEKFSVGTDTEGKPIAFSPGESLEAMRTEISREQLSEYQSRVQRYNLLNGTHARVKDLETGMPAVAAPRVVAALKYLLEAQGEWVGDWSISFDPDRAGESPRPSYTFGFADQAMNPIYAFARQELIPYLIEKDPSLFDLVSEPRGTSALLDFGGRQREFCEKLKARSLRALAP